MPATTVEAVRAGTDSRCHESRCRDSGCSLLLHQSPQPNVLISLEHEASPAGVDEPRCDFLFVGGEDGDRGAWVAPIELTTGNKRASEFVTQLRAGAVIADRLLPQGVQTRFSPVAVHDGLRPVESRNLKKPSNRVNFRGKSVAIQLVRCGSRLADALQE